MDFLKFIKDLAATVGQRLKYGAEARTAVEVTMAASQACSAASARFVTLDSSGNAALTTASDTTIFGSVEGWSGASTSVNDKLMCDTGLDVIYRIPVSSGTYARSLRGTLIDLAISGTVQGAAVGTSTRDHLILVDGDEVNNAWVLVKINGAKQAK